MRKPMRGLAYFSVIGIFGSGLDAIAQTPDGAASSAVPGIAAPLADGRAGIASLAGAAPAPRSGAVNVISPAAQSSSARLAAPSSLTPGSSATRASTIQRGNLISSAAPRSAATARLSAAAPGASTFPANSATRLAGAAPPSAAISCWCGERRDAFDHGDWSCVCICFRRGRKLGYRRRKFARGSGRRLDQSAAVMSLRIGSRPNPPIHPSNGLHRSALD